MSRSPQEMMRSALDGALLQSSEDLPIQAIIFDPHGSILASSGNAVMERGQITAHAELLALANVDLKLLKSDGSRMSMAVTLEPCPMCAWAIRSAGIGRLVFGAYNSQYGAAGSVYDLLRHRRSSQSVEVIGGVLEVECQKLLDQAFINMRNNSAR